MARRGCQRSSTAPVPRQNNELLSNEVHKLCVRFGLFPCKTALMLSLLRLLVVLSTRDLCSRRDLVLENLALRQQLGVLKQKHPRPRLEASDRLFWVVCGGSGPAGRWHWSLSSRRPSFVGTVQDSSSIGRGSRGIRLKPEESASAGNCANSSSAWLPRTGLGVRPGSMEN